MTKGGKLIEGIFSGATINTPSMLCVEDCLSALTWAEGVGRAGLVDRCDRSAAAIWEFCDRHDWIANLADDPATRSTTSVCLKLIGAPEGLAKRMAKRLEAEGVALDIGAYRDAPEGLRIWCGATVDPEDVAALMPWVEWAYHQETCGDRDAPGGLISPNTRIIRLPGSRPRVGRSRTPMTIGA